MIPKRNIETWVLCLSGQSVDEDADYRHEPDIDKQIAPPAETLFAWTRANATLPTHAVSSLRLAIPELKRLE